MQRERFLRSVRVAALLTGVVVLSQVASAAPTTTNEKKVVIPEYNLGTVVVTASRYGQTEYSANANISVVSHKQIEQMHYTSLEEALRAVPGVDAVGYGGAGHDSAATLSINGSKNVVLIVDGVRYTQGVNDGFPTTMFNSLEDVERIEVLKGSATTLYGADAKGGVINIITRRPEKQRTKVTAAAGNFGKQLYSISTEGKSENFTYWASYKKSKAGDYKDGNGETVINKSDKDIYGARFSYEYKKGSTIGINYNNSKENFTYNDAFYGDGIVNGHNKVEDFGLVWKHKINKRSTNQLAIKQINSRYDYLAEGSGNFYDQKVKTFAISDQYTNTTKKNTFIAGFDYNKDSVDYHNIYADNMDTDITQKGIYVQDTYKFTKQFETTVGLRYADHSMAGKKWVPKVEFGYDIDDQSRVYVTYNRFFVAPTTYQYFSPYGNRNLEAETGDTYQIGFNHKFGKKINLSISAFKTHSNNRIVWDGNTYNPNTGWNGIYVNAGESNITGYNIKLSDRFTKHFSGYISYTYQNIEDIANGTTTYMNSGYLPQSVINVGLNYNVKKWDLALIGKGTIGKGKGNEDLVQSLPATTYWTFDFAANYKPTKNVKIFALLNNIFNQMYAENVYQPGQWYGMPGRSFMLGVECTF